MTPDDATTRAPATKADRPTVAGSLAAGAAAGAAAGGNGEHRPVGRPMIELTNLRKVYSNDVVAVNNVSLTVREGEMFCVLGPNGAGKTTTIKLLTGLLRPTAGMVRIGGHDIQTEPVAAKRLIGYIPDHPYLYEKLSGRDFFRFVADLFGVPNDIWEERMHYYFDLFKLTKSLDLLIENYSHGMRQKLCFSVALMHNPKVIVVDEPFVGLDPESSRLVKTLLRQECDRGACVFLSLHQLADAETMADRLVIYKHGEVIFNGTFPELRKARGRHDGRLEDIFLEMTLDEGEGIREP